MRLSKRLELVASFVPAGGRAADVGTDHGYIPIALVERGIVSGAIAMDLRPGPLERAKEHVRQAGLSDRIETRLSDGLSRLSPGEAETVVVAGMGGELVIRILEEGRHMWESVERFVLSPQSEIDKVRRYLERSGFVTVREAMTEEDGKFYTVMAVRWKDLPAPEAPGPEGDYRYGAFLMKAKDPVLKRFLLWERERVDRILSRMPEAAGGETAQAREKLTGELSLIDGTLKEMDRTEGGEG